MLYLVSIMYYHILESNPQGWDDTDLLLYKYGATHYLTIYKGPISYRKYVLNCSEDEIIIMKLTFSGKVEITELSTDLYNHLQQTGYIKE